MSKKAEKRASFLQDEIRDEYLDLIRDAISKGSPFTFRAHGSSMFPIIPGGTEVTVETFDPMPPPVGTICVGIKRGRLFCHRLVEVKTGPEGKRLYILKGDNHRFTDEPFGEEDLVGKVTFLRYRRLKLSSEFLPLQAAGKFWMNYPNVAIPVTRIAWKLTKPARFVSKRLLGLLNLARHGNENH